MKKYPRYIGLITGEILPINEEDFIYDHKILVGKVDYSLSKKSNIMNAFIKALMNENMTLIENGVIKVDLEDLRDVNNRYLGKYFTIELLYSIRKDK